MSLLPKTLDLLLKEVQDPYAQENFWRLKLYLEQLISLGGVPGPIGPPGPPGPIGPITDDLGEPFFADSQDVSTPGSWQTLMSVPVPSLIQRKLHRLYVVCRMESQWKVTVGGNIIASGRTGAATPLNVYAWYPARPYVDPDVFLLEIKVRSFCPPVEIEAYLMATDSVIP